MIFTASEDRVRVCGRTLWVEDVRYLGYSGSSISFTFVGRRASARIRSNAFAYGEALNGRIAVYANGELYSRICLDRAEGEYVLYESEAVAQVTVTVMKYSEAAFGKCGIESIEIDTDELLPPPAPKARKMEIIGDSITCGYGVEAENELTPFHTATENPAKSYSLLTAAALDADVQMVCWSGNGIISGYVEESAEKPSDHWLMPEVYRYTDISCSEMLFGSDDSKWEKWDFGRFTPDIILVNLGTNDCSWCKDIQSRRDSFREHYAQFLTDLHRQNPSAKILCMLGTMDQRVLKEAAEAAEMANCHFLPLPAQLAEDGYGADWHPSPLTHQKTAALVVEKVREIMGW